MPEVALSQIVAGRNARTVPVPAIFEEGLRRSIETQGVLQPILLRPHEDSDKLEIVLGHRRFGAAQALGLPTIPAEIKAMTAAEVEKAQFTENVQRQAMHPVDQWRAVRELIQDHGLTFEQSAGALGLSDRLMRRMEQLGRLNPTLLKLAEIDMPSPTQLRKIASASAKLQAQATKIKGLIVARGDTETVDWHQVVMRCETRRIPRSTAIFDPAEKGIAWDEDLFAEPGADDQFTTADVDGFRHRQTKALQARVAELVKAKKRHQLATMKDRFSIALPAGFRISYGKPERLKAHEWAFHAVSEDGTIRVETAIDTKAAKAAEKTTPTVRATAAPSTNADPDDDDADEDGDEEDEAPRAAEAKPPFTKKGLALIASAKTAALRKALDGTPMAQGFVLKLLVLALCARNISVRGADDGFEDLARRMLAPGGNLLDLSTADIVQIGQTAIGRMLSFEGADRGGYMSVFSGDAAEWVGAAIAAHAALDRFDTKEFLETASVAELKRAAIGAGLLTSSKDTAASLRERLIGRAPDYRPEAAVFGAPAPKERAGV